MFHLKNVIRIIFINLIFLLVLSMRFADAQLYDLCGIWYSNDYFCSGPNFTETFAISHSGNYVIATKIVGDDCVTSGHVSWEGEYTSSSFQVILWYGSPSNPNYFTALKMVTVIDSTHLLVNFMSVYKYKCEELYKMNIYPTDYSLDCYCESIVIPNIFTPNGDSKNDMFYIKDLPYESNLTIYNRWGNSIFQSDNYDNKWDGEGTSNGVYYYFLVTKNGKIYKGTLTILR